MTSPQPVAPPVQSLAGNRNFHLLWLGEGVSVLGNATTGVLIPLLAVVSLDAGPGWMGILTAAPWLPWLLVGLPAGAWVDRLPSRRVMIVSDLVAAATIATVPLAWLLDALTLLHLVLAALANGACTVFFRAAYPRLVRQVAPAGLQERAFSRLLGTESAMQVAGPGLGGLLVQIVSAAWGLLLDAATFLFSAYCLWRMGPSTAEEKQNRETEAAPLRRRIVEGIAYIRRDRLLTYFIVLGGASNFGLTGYGALLVLFMADDLAISPTGIGLVLALGSVGGLVGAALAPRISDRWGSVRGLLWLQLLAGPPALLIPLATLGAGTMLIVVGVLVVGVGVVGGNVIRGAWRNRYVPADMLARQVATAQVVNFGTMPIAGLLAGWLGVTLGLRPTIVVMAAVHAAACLAIWWSPIRGKRDLPTGRPPEPARK